MVMTGGWFIIVLPTLMIIMGYTWIYHLSTGAGVRNHPQYVCYTDVFLPCPSAVAVPLFFAQELVLLPWFLLATRWSMHGESWGYSNPQKDRSL